LLNIPQPMTDWLVAQLTIDNPLFLEAVKHGRYIKNIPPSLKMYKLLQTGIVIPRGYLQLLEDIMIGRGLDLTIVDNRVLLPPVSYKFEAKLTPYQVIARFKLLTHPNGMLIAPAASGKTVIGLNLVATLRQPTLWLTHTKRLAKQVIDRIVGSEEHPPIFSDIDRKEIGLIGMGKNKIGERITIGMIPTLARNEEFLLENGKKFGLIILDEAHHAPASTFTKVLTYLSSYYLYGLTATPYRRDKLEELMFACIGQGNAIVQRREVKKQGRIITPSVKPRIVPMPVVESNDYHEIISEVVLPAEHRKNLITNDVIREARRGSYCIVISTRKSYCEDLFKKIFEYWSKTVIATGDYTQKHNDEQVKKIEGDEATVLITTFELLGEGFDVPKLNRAFLALPFREKARVEQMVGRIQRTTSGKEDAIIYDYIDANIGILNNQYLSRLAVYKSLGMPILEE